MSNYSESVKEIKDSPEGKKFSMLFPGDSDSDSDSSSGISGNPSVFEKLARNYNKSENSEIARKNSQNRENGNRSVKTKSTFFLQKF